MDYNLKFAFAIVFLIVFGVALQSAHCATSSPRRDNSLGVVISSDNPLMYNMGFMAHGQIIEDEKGREYTSIDFAPYGGPMLFPESILLCGNQAEPLMEHPMKVVVLTYERQAHTMYKGIGCHKLVGVNLVAGQEDKQ